LVSVLDIFTNLSLILIFLKNPGGGVHMPACPTTLPASTHGDYHNGSLNKVLYFIRGAQLVES
jgi:hypothetical protein